MDAPFFSLVAEFFNKHVSYQKARIVLILSPQEIVLWILIIIFY